MMQFLDWWTWWTRPLFPSLYENHASIRDAIVPSFLQVMDGLLLSVAIPLAVGAAVFWLIPMIVRRRRAS